MPPLWRQCRVTVGGDIGRWILRLGMTDRGALHMMRAGGCCLVCYTAYEPIWCKTDAVYNAIAAICLFHVRRTEGKEDALGCTRRGISSRRRKR